MRAPGSKRVPVNLVPMPTEHVSVILTAGASTRFGGHSKALMSIQGEPAVARLVRVSQDGGFRPLVVLGAHAAEIRAALGSTPVDLVENPSWADGRTGSIQRGIEQISEESEVLVWPVDHPFVQAKTLRRLRTAAEHDAMGVWFVPTFEGRNGHPVLLKPVVLRRLKDLRPSTPLRSLIPEFGPQVAHIPVDDPGVRANVDTEEDYQRFQSLLQPGEDGL
jgi:molybdenum cofactor cytidylyltransferase